MADNVDRVEVAHNDDAAVMAEVPPWCNGEDQLSTLLTAAEDYNRHAKAGLSQEDIQLGAIKYHLVIDPFFLPKEEGFAFKLKDWTDTDHLGLTRKWC